MIDHYTEPLLFWFDPFLLPSLALNYELRWSLSVSVSWVAESTREGISCLVKIN